MPRSPIISPWSEVKTTNVFSLSPERSNGVHQSLYINAAPDSNGDFDSDDPSHPAESLARWEARYHCDRTNPNTHC